MSALAPVMMAISGHGRTIRVNPAAGEGHPQPALVLLAALIGGGGGPPGHGHHQGVRLPGDGPQ